MRPAQRPDSPRQAGKAGDATRARPVFDHELLAEPLRQLVGKDPRHDVGVATGGERDNDRYRLDGHLSCAIAVTVSKPSVMAAAASFARSGDGICFLRFLMTARGVARRSQALVSRGPDLRNLAGGGQLIGQLLGDVGRVCRPGRPSRAMEKFGVLQTELSGPAYADALKKERAGYARVIEKAGIKVP